MEGLDRKEKWKEERMERAQNLSIRYEQYTYREIRQHIIRIHVMLLMEYVYNVLLGSSMSD